MPSVQQPVPQANVQAPPAPAINPSVAPVAPVAPESKKPVALEERFVVGEEYEKSITNLMEMGFPREDVVKALKAAFNNPERATDYLLNVFIYL
jgi:UV excision repair protein RAD23